MNEHVLVKAKTIYYWGDGRVDIVLGNDARIITVPEDIIVRHTDNRTITGKTDTSRAAALAARPKSGTQRARILDFIERRGEYGATDEEIQETLGIVPNSQRPRRGELVTGGWVVDSGRRRLTASGNDSIVWVRSDDE